MFGRALAKTDRIYVAMSGGIDSSVSAGLLVRAGYSDIRGVFMRNWREQEAGTACTSERDYRDVRAVCSQLDIPCELVDLSREYWHKVFAPALDVYKAGGTPNPDVACNRYVKCGALVSILTKREEQRPWWLATGHYADVRHGRLCRPKDRHKDQSFFLSTVIPSAMAKMIFPLAEHTKDEVRAMARELDLPSKVSRRRESQGLCFVEPDTRRFSSFLSNYLEPGPVIYTDENGNKLTSDHRGIWATTIGEASGLQLPQGNMLTKGKWYVARKTIGKHIEPAVITLVRGRQHPMLWFDRCTVEQFHWSGELREGELLCQVRHRGNMLPRAQSDPHREEVAVACRVSVRGDKVDIRFSAPQFAVTPGQHLALYAGDMCLGGGPVKEAFSVDQDVVAPARH
ncbi:hypothetical protein PYCC9005_001475 [Savitreella phatthalungensis]